MGGRDHAVHRALHTCSKPAYGFVQKFMVDSASFVAGVHPPSEMHTIFGLRSLTSVAKPSALKNFWKVAGPGILFASTAIGVSHLVQSTRAGAVYGFGLLWAVFFANLLKYPFFEYGSRYANVTGKSLIDGYMSIGKWMFWLYVAITLASMFFVSAAVGATTAGFMQNLFGLDSFFGSQSQLVTTALLFTICAGILLRGQYKALDRLIKIVGSVLVISTVFVFFAALIKGPSAPEISWITPELDGSNSALPFLIALMGWMPTAIDLSTWNSLWTLERIKDSGYKPTLNETLRDFNVGYLISAILAICFITLGAFLLYGTGEEIPEGAVGFSDKIITMYTRVMGSWSYPFIAAAGFSIMFGTCIAVFDGYARAGQRCVEVIAEQKGNQVSHRKTYNVMVVLIAVASFFVIFTAGKSLTTLVDLATTVSFLIAPVVASANLYLVTRNYYDTPCRPPDWMLVLSWIGLIFLTVFAAIFVFT